MKLKRLFSPRLLATTIATTMLAHATFTALAAGYYNVSAVRKPGVCPSGAKTCPDGNSLYYWCCQGGSSCVGTDAVYDAGLGAWIGWCYAP